MILQLFRQPHNQRAALVLGRVQRPPGRFTLMIDVGSPAASALHGLVAGPGFF